MEGLTWMTVGATSESQPAKGQIGKGFGAAEEADKDGDAGECESG